MAKFNISGATLQKEKLAKITTTNRAGGKAYDTSKEFKLVSLLLSSFLTNQAYRSGDQTLIELKALIDAIEDKTFVAKAAVYARDKFNMRSVTHVVAGELIDNGAGIPGIRNFFKNVVVRPDDMLEIVSYYAANGAKYRNVKGAKKIKLPFRVKAGFREAFDKFDNYQIAKYQKKNAGFSLLDLVNIVGPIPTDKNKDALKSLVEGTLVSSGTFESELSAAGQADDAETAKTEAWASLVKTGKIGYMALVKNLRNIIETKDESIVNAACELLVDEKRARNSRMLPFRVLSAYFEIEKMPSDKLTRKVLSGLSTALEILMNNAPELDGETLVVVDDSGSMTSAMVANSKNTNCMSMAAAIGVVIAKRNNSDIVLFSDTAREFNYNPANPAMTIVNDLRSKAKAGGTNLSSVFELVNKKKKKYDRVVVLSDMQSWMDCGYGSTRPDKTFSVYKTSLGVDPFVYSIDLAGYGTSQFRPDKVALMAGFSDKLFDIMTMCETDKNALINEINAIEF